MSLLLLFMGIYALVGLLHCGYAIWTCREVFFYKFNFAFLGWAVVFCGLMWPITLPELVQEVRNRLFKCKAKG